MKTKPFRGYLEDYAKIRSVKARVKREMGIDICDAKALNILLKNLK